MQRSPSYACDLCELFSFGPFRELWSQIDFDISLVAIAKYIRIEVRPQQW